ncbi:hypothetical protein HZV92_003154 [Salmonella enterica]|nr:hypothetical protein [Salmonella enterica]EFQ6619444.1 hypothetical protein [Salmonella enterica]
MFPSLSGILNKIEQEVCQAAQSEIDQYIPSTIDPWGDMPVPDIPDISVSATRQPVSSPAPALQPSAPAIAESADTSDAPVFSLN